MATILNIYGTKTAVTITLASLANGSGRESTVIDNTTTKFLDMLLRVTTKGAASGTNLLDIYAYAALGDTTYTDGATGTDAAFTTANKFNARYIGSVLMNAATAVQAAMFSVAQAFGGVLPDKVGFIFINNSGAALDATGGSHVVEYEGISQSVA